MWGCEHAPGHKAAAEEEDAPAQPFEAGHGNGQHGAGSLLTARRRLAVPPKAQPAPSAPTLGLPTGHRGARGEQRWATKSRWQSGVKPVRCRSPRGGISSGADGARGAGRGRRYRGRRYRGYRGAAVPGGARRYRAGGGGAGTGPISLRTP